MKGQGKRARAPPFCAALHKSRRKRWWCEKREATTDDSCLLFVVGPRRRKAEKERGETREQCGFWGRSKEGAQMIRKAQQRFFFSLSLSWLLLKRLSTIMYLHAKKKPPKCLNERDKNPPLKPPLDKDRRDIMPIMGLEEQYSSRPMAGSRDVQIHHSCFHFIFTRIFIGTLSTLMGNVSSQFQKPQQHYY